MELDTRELQRLKELVPYKVLAPTPDEIIKEIERLNNIIDELEKDAIELMKSYKDVNAPRYDMCKYFIYKIQELKEGK